MPTFGLLINNIDVSGQYEKIEKVVSCRGKIDSSGPRAQDIYGYVCDFDSIKIEFMSEEVPNIEDFKWLIKEKLDENLIDEGISKYGEWI